MSIDQHLARWRVHLFACLPDLECPKAIEGWSVDASCWIRESHSLDVDWELRWDGMPRCI